MLLLSRLRLALARRPYLYWLFVITCVAIVWSLLASSQAKLEDERKRWGETQRVWIAAEDFAPGDVIRSVARDYPSAMVPATAIDDAPVGVVAIAPIAAGEVLVDSDVDATTDDFLEADWVVFAFERDRVPALHIGSGVVVFGSGQRWCEGIVVALGDEEIEVGVPPTCADAVSAQIAAGGVVLAASG